MESSSVIRYEYFELVKKLNQANKLKNQETELYFYIDSTNSGHFKLYAAISEYQKILLCEKWHKSLWTKSGFSQYENLEDYIALLLRVRHNQNDLTNHIKSHIFKLTR